MRLTHSSPDHKGDAVVTATNVRRVVVVQPIKIESTPYSFSVTFPDAQISCVENARSEFNGDDQLSQLPDSN